MSVLQETAAGRCRKRTFRSLEPFIILERNVDFPAEMFPSTQSVTPLLCSCEETIDIARIATLGRQNCRARAGWCVGTWYDREKRYLAEAPTAHWVWNSLSMILPPETLLPPKVEQGHVSERLVSDVSQQYISILMLLQA